MNKKEQQEMMRDLWHAAEDAEEVGDLKTALMLNVAGNILFNINNKGDAETLIKQAVETELAD